MVPLPVLPHLAACLTAIVVVACGGGASLTPPPQAPPRVVTFASGLEHPWSLAFLPDGRLLVSERAGRLRIVAADGRSLSPPLAGVPAVDARGQGGLFDIALDPGFAVNATLFISYAEAGSGGEAGRNGVAVMRAVLDAATPGLREQRVIFRQRPKVASSGHFGGRLAFARDGTLFVTLGDRQLDGERAKAQDLALGHGKVMRITRDGGVPADNPFVATAAAQPEIWSYGHRNVQGAAIHPVSGALWTSEHGPQGGDEVNLTLAGRNHGWPRVSYGCEYGSPVGRCTPVGGASSGPGFEPPKTWWVPTSIAPSGLAFYTGERFPEWRGQLFAGALAGQALWRIELDGDSVVRREELFKSLGERIRDVRQGPDGWLYLLTDSSAGKVLRVER